MNFPHGWETFCLFPSTFCAAKIPSMIFLCVVRTSINFRQVSVWCEALCQLLSAFHAARRLSGNFPCRRGPTFNFLCGQVTVRQCSVRQETLHQLFMQPADLLSTSVNFPYIRETFCQRLSTFCVGRRTLVSFCQLSMPPGDLPSNSVNFYYGQDT